MNEHEGVKRVVYGGRTYGETVSFVPVCVTCGRFVKADPTVMFNGLREYIDKDNATCKKCGRTKMLFEGFC